MLVRPIQYIRTLQRLQIINQRLSTQTVVNRSYATFELNSRKSSKDFQINPHLSTIFSIRYASQQLKPTEGTEKNIKRGLEYVMGRLESAYQWNGFIGLEQLQPLMEAIKTNPNVGLTSEQGLFLLNVCGCEIPSQKPEERIEYFQEIWQLLQQADLITKDHYHTMLQVLQYNRAPLKDHKAFLQEYQKHNGSPKEIYSELLAVAGANGNVKQTTELLAEMRSLQLALTERDFNSLILAHARANDMNGCQRVRDSMHATGLPLSTETQSTLVAAFMENSEEADASIILQQYHGQFQAHQVLKMLQSVTMSTGITQEFVSQLVKEFKPDYIRGPEVPISVRRICVELLQNE